MRNKGISLKSSKRVRMQDVADRCGVSISTVSLVLSGDARIPEDTTRRVLQTVKALEYRPSVVARNLARRFSRTIGVILPQFAFEKNQPFYYQALQGIHSQTQTAGYKMVVEAANPSFIERRYYHRLLKEQSADGMIYMAAGINDGFLSEMQAEPYPFVLVGGVAEGVSLPTVKGPDFEGAKMAVRHLLKLGHKKIGHVAGSKTHSMGRDRERGYYAAMEEAGLSPQKEWVQNGDFDLGTAESAALQLQSKRVTALFAGNDMMAMGVLRGLRKKGVKVPAEMAIMGMDDLTLSQWVSPALSTVRFDISSLAGLAAQYVIKKIHAPLIGKDFLTDVPKPELIIRDSCGGKH